MKKYFYGIIISGISFTCCYVNASEQFNFNNELVFKTFNFDRDYNQDPNSNSSSLTQGFLSRRLVYSVRFHRTITITSDA